MGAREKLNNVNKEIERRNRKKRVFLIYGVLALQIILVILLSYRANDIFSMQALVCEKILIAAAAIVGAVMVCLSIFFFSYFHNISDAALGIILGMPVLLLVVTIVFLSQWFAVDRVLCDNNGCVYYERKAGYELVKLPEGERDIILSNEMEGKQITAFAAFYTEDTQTLTIVGGNWTLTPADFSQTCRLRSINIQNATVNVDKKTFTNCLELTEINLVNTAFTVTIDESITKSYKKNLCVFANENVSITLNNSTIKNVVDNVKCITVAGESSVKSRMHIPASKELLAQHNRIVITDGTTLEFSEFMNNNLSYWTQENTYYPIGYTIYLPISLKTIPAYFFGNVSDTEQKIQVYYAGTEEEWDNVWVEEIGNENYTNGNVNLTFNHSYEDH